MWGPSMNRLVSHGWQLAANVLVMVGAAAIGHAFSSVALFAKIVVIWHAAAIGIVTLGLAGWLWFWCIGMCYPRYRTEAAPEVTRPLHAPLPPLTSVGIGRRFSRPLSSPLTLRRIKPRSIPRSAADFCLIVLDAV